MAGVTLDDLGGPVYPQETLNGDGSTSRWFGMNLHDYFAAAAMRALIGRHGNVIAPPDSVAVYAYACADAMLAARERREGE